MKNINKKDGSEIGKIFDWKNFDMDKFFKEANLIKRIGYRLDEKTNDRSE